ncbi:MAG: MBL fold metallo-hydrolase [Cyanobacteria bacterium SZAS TMP-1]|nr:MBL fold metallo-hydrolase [Cyanobacteria bacterium SZAS TMP-1]
MADEKKLVNENVAGNFFVDRTCINCDTCRQLAPDVFADQGEYSYVRTQPVSPLEEVYAMRALLACPVGSIGNRSKIKPNVMDDFPLPITDDVYYCGFNSAASYGGNSFFVTHPEGNWLIDSPKYLPHLVRRFTALGGIKYIFLTHRDDVADADKYAAEFGAQRLIHRDELSAQPESEIVIDEREQLDFAPDFKIIVTPGHTRGHMVLLYKNTVLFTGDHLAYDPDDDSLYAHESHCWYSWAEQTKSMRRLLAYDFEWVLAGHGNRVHLPRERMKEKLTELVARMH